jgi:CheY-like chemotaxis protein
MIVEDEEAVMELLSSIFSDTKSYSVIITDNGESALQIAKSKKPDIILLDIMIPKINGYEVCQRLKQNQDTSHIKILMLSGMTQNSDLHKAFEAGADAFISKPFSLFDILSKVESLLKS